MKAIMVMFDTLNRHHLPNYGCGWVKAPNFERLAQRTVQFQNSYSGSLPCMPARRELHTGRYNFLHRSWGPLEPFDDSMPQILKENGVYTHLCTDHQHYFEDGGATYHTRYNSWQFSRGQEGDPWMGQVEDPEFPDDALGKRYLSGAPQDELAPQWRQEWVNREFMKKEEQQPQAKTFRKGLDFIRRNVDQDSWFLQMETFDPHEPYYTQQRYKNLYPHDYDGPHFDWPPYGRAERTPDQDEHVRQEYAALVTMCDEYLGKVLDMMDELEMWDDTLLIVNTDHGFLLGEHNWWGKVVQPFYQEIVHTPLMIWDPRSQRQGVRCDSLVQTMDLPATLLEFFGLDRPKDMQGIPLKDALANDTPVHEAVIFGVFGGHINCTDGKHVLMLAPGRPENEPLNHYTLTANHMRALFVPEELAEMEVAGPLPFTKGAKVMKLPAKRTLFDAPQYDYYGHPLETMLFDVASNPAQETQIEDDAIAARLTKEIERLMRENDAPAEQFERMGLEAG
ncbi:MAG: sulfatase [Chloroflexota bacterium]|jgi:arylsulfatase A-like enzyme|nr:sulfatase [Chloroflexota bacterium]MDP6509221.1 sulfatase [Chloroflexota bacterium]MDP6757651.1 sulfatase [Chloroflexota bacterium]